MDRITRTWMSFLALWLGLAGSVPCAAQPPAPPSTMSPEVNLLAREPAGSSIAGLPSVAPSSNPPTSSSGASFRGPGLPPALPMPPIAPSSMATDEHVRLPAALETGLTLKRTPLEPTDLRFPINLATALRLSDARPLIVAAAQARVWVAEAELTRAKLLWIPTLNIGFDYIRHDGGGPDFNKGIMTAPSTNFFYAGAGLTGAPLGLIHTTDAIYQP